MPKKYKPGQLVIKKVYNTNQLLRIASTGDIWTNACVECIIHGLACMKRTDEKINPICLWCIQHLDGDCYFTQPIKPKRS